MLELDEDSWPPGTTDADEDAETLFDWAAQDDDDPDADSTKVVQGYRKVIAAEIKDCGPSKPKPRLGLNDTRS